MNKIKSFLGYFWAALGIPIVLVMLLGSNAWVNLIAASGLEVSPWFTGGDVIHTAHGEGWMTEIHEPVFQALIGERKTGFVQVNWKPLNGALTIVDEDVDYNADGQPDFHIRWDVHNAEPELTALQPAVLGLDSFYRFKDDSAAVRVSLRREK